MFAYTQSVRNVRLASKLFYTQCVITRTEQQKQIDAIVGAAVRKLAASGASDAELGEFAEHHRNTINQVLGASPASPLVDDLSEVIESAIKKALKAAMSGEEVRTRVRYHLKMDNRRTSVTLLPNLVREAHSQFGKNGTKKLMEDLATNMPSEVQNRSLWLEQRLQYALQQSVQAGQAGAGATH